MATSTASPAGMFNVQWQGPGVEEPTSASVAERPAPRAQLIRLHPGQVIFRQGDRADHFYLVRLGFVKVSQTRSGGEHVLNYIGPGGYFGEIGLLSELPELRDLAPPGARTARSYSSPERETFHPVYAPGRLARLIFCRNRSRWRTWS